MIEIEKLINEITDGRLSEVTKLGLCRRWTRAALDQIEEYGDLNRVELHALAVEITTKSGIDHSFVRLEVDRVTYLLDGVGVEFFPPYFGLESEAPEHLQGSHPDNWINNDRKFGK